jgi:hypothetical protein
MSVALIGALALGACGDDGGTNDGSAATTTSRPTTTEVPTFTGDADSEFCALLRDVDLRTITGDGEGSSVEAAFQQLIDLFLDAELVAPPEIKPDMTLLGQGIFLLDQSLFDVGYDFDKLPDDVVRAVNDPAFAEAGARITAYRQQVCGL